MYVEDIPDTKCVQMVCLGLCDGSEPKRSLEIHVFSRSLLVLWELLKVFCRDLNVLWKPTSSVETHMFPRNPLVLRRARRSVEALVFSGQLCEDTDCDKTQTAYVTLHLQLLPLPL